MMAALKAAREKAGLTQRDLAARLKRSKNYVHYVEIGTTMLDAIEFMQYARACDADPYRLMRKFDPARARG